MADRAGRVLITGAGGFVGQALVTAIAKDNPDLEIVATDLAPPRDPSAARLDWRSGSLDDAAFLADLTAEPFDFVAHLATVAGVQSMDFDFGRRINLTATQALFEAISRPDRPPRLVYASSMGVFGPPLPPAIGDDTLPVPTTSYGAHKLIGELLVGDYARAGRIDGLALRLPGILARPAGSQTMKSAFLSNLFHAVQAHQPIDLPLAADDGTWAMSRRRTVAALRHALDLPRADLSARRYWALPALFVTMGDLVAALAGRFGSDATSQVRFAPDPAVQAMFAQVPLDAAGATKLGFRGDPDVDALVAAVVDHDMAPVAA